MKKLKQTLQNQRGETIVEVLVSFVLLMLFLALFTVSLRYARRASVQAQTTRDNAYNLTSVIYPANDATASWDEGTEKTLDFGRFTVQNVQLQTIEAEVTKKKNDESEETEVIASHTFTRYYKDEKYYKANNENEDTNP